MGWAWTTGNRDVIGRMQGSDNNNKKKENVSELLVFTMMD